MSRVIIFSREFPAYHPKAGQQTFFVEMFWGSIGKQLSFIADEPEGLEVEVYRYMTNEFIQKHHTIRAGNRWKVGDKFSPRVWALLGGMYVKGNKMITISPDVEVKKIWNVEIFQEGGSTYIGIRTGENAHELLSFGQVAANDGLTFEDMKNWFNVKPNKPFVGQIICWNENINY